jgi:hypothetical protein
MCVTNRLTPRPSRADLIPACAALAAAAAGWTPGLAWAALDGDGLSADTPAASCLAIHQRDVGAGDGAYWVGRTQGAPVRVYCDMTADGGGWQVLFHGKNPRKWATRFGDPGGEEWGVDETGVPADISELRLKRKDTDQRRIIPMTNAALYDCSAVDDKYIWNGTASESYAAVGLGISTVKSNYPPPVGYVLSGMPCNNDHKSFGFGHRAWIDDHQGWGWNSLDLGPTSFQIAVR